MNINKYIIVICLILASTWINAATINYTYDPCALCVKKKLLPAFDYRKIDWNDESVTMPLEDLQDMLDEIKELRGDHNRRCR